MLEYLMAVSLAYSVGSISSAIVVCRCLGLPDPRTQGSRNPGATNVLRLSGKGAAAVTLTGDLLKGLAPLLVGRLLDAPETWLASMGLAVLLGHVYPVFFGFQGGKGVATYIGVLYGLVWPAGIAFTLAWLLVAYLFRYSSLAALAATASSPVFVLLFHPSPLYLLAVVIMVALVVWRHRPNIEKLLAGTEGKMGAK